MTALEMQLAAARSARRSVSLGVSPDVVTDAVLLGDQETPVVNARPELMYVAEAEAAKLLPSSQCFAWTADMTEAVWLASRSIPSDAAFSYDLFPDGLRTCWWWFEWPLPIPLTGAARRDGVDSEHIAGVLLAYRHDDSLLVVDFRRVDTPAGPIPAPAGFFVIPPGLTLGGVRQARNALVFDATVTAPLSPRTLALARFILAASTWLHQRIAVMGSGHIERHRRKQFGREIGGPAPTDVKVISLRRMESTHSPSADGEPVEWSCRWIVSGHWRNQPYKDERRLIYIMPHVKGPEDRPLKVPSHTVYAVNR
jgi:hypothetical protein